MVRIFDVPREYVDLAEELTVTIMAGEEPSPELIWRLQAFKSDGPNAIDAWVNAIQEQDAAIAGIKKRMDQLASKKTAITKTVSYMRDVLTNVVDTIAAGHYRGEWTVYTSDPQVIEVHVRDRSLVPAEFLTQIEPTVKLVELKKAIKAGQDIPGVVGSFTTEHRLTIRS